MPCAVTVADQFVVAAIDPIHSMSSFGQRQHRSEPARKFSWFMQVVTEVTRGDSPIIAEKQPQQLVRICRPRPRHNKAMTREICHEPSGTVQFVH